MKRPSLGALCSRHSLFAAGSFVLIGNAVFGLSYAAIIVIIARFGNPAMLGDFSLATAIVSPVFVLTDLNLRVLQASDSAGRFSLGDYLGVRAITFPLSIVLVGLLVAIIPVPPRAAHTALVLAVAKTAESLSFTAHGTYVRRGAFGSLAVSMSLRGLLGSIAFGIAFAVDQHLLRATGLLALTWWITVFITDSACLARLVSLRSVKPSFIARHLRALVRSGLPLGLDAAMASLTFAVPRYAIHAQLGAAALGVFGGLSQLSYTLIVLAGSVVTPAVPRLADYAAEGKNNEFRRLLRRLVKLWAVLAAGGLLLAFTIGSSLAGAVLGTAYADRALISAITAMAAAAIIQQTLLKAVQATHRFTVAAAIDGAVLAVTGITIFPAVYFFGTIGAPLAMIAGFLVGLALSSKQLRHNLTADHK